MSDDWEDDDAPDHASALDREWQQRREQYYNVIETSRREAFLSACLPDKSARVAYCRAGIEKAWTREKTKYCNKDLMKVQALPSLHPLETNI